MRQKAFPVVLCVYSVPTPPLYTGFAAGRVNIDRPGAPDLRKNQTARDESARHRAGMTLASKEYLTLPRFIQYEHLGLLMMGFAHNEKSSVF